MTNSSVNHLRSHSTSIGLSLIGNPTIEDGNDYDQDFVLPLGKELESAEFQRQKELIDKYIENILAGWDYGFSDTVFNFMINAGVTKGDKVILIDLGELSWNEYEVRKLVEGKHWEKRSSFSKLRNFELKNHIQERFNDKITLSNLDKRWNSKVDNSSSKVVH